MNSPAPRTDAERSAYLRTVLQMNPLQRAEEILALRNRYRRIKPTGAVRAATEDDPRELRQQAVDGLQRIRDLFWKEKLSVLQQMLDALPLKTFPDLRKAGQRLKVMAAHRQDFPGLADEPGFDAELFSRLKQILVISPRDAGPHKEAVQESFAERKVRKRALKMLALLEQQLPEVYRLEEDWFDLLRSSSAARWSRRPLEQGTSSGGSPLRYLWFLIPVVVSVVVAVLNPRSNQNKPPTVRRTFPTESQQLLTPTRIPEPNRTESMQKLIEQARRRQEEQRRGLPFGPPGNPQPFGPPPVAPRNP